ncbi:MAG: IclR family transcriptional regulator [Acidimicrobiia bacterium]
MPGSDAGAIQEPDRPSGLLLTLNRGIQVLERVATERGRATAKSLVADLEINLGTCYQILRTLQHAGYVHRLPGGRYVLGTRVGYLSDRYDSAVAPSPQLLDILHDLHQALGETVYITLRHNADLPIVGLLEGTNMLRVGSLTVGYSGHPHIRASAKAYLAHVPPASVDGFFETRTFAALTPNTITSWDGLLAELDATRLRGYGIDREEFTAGVSCIGAVILGADAQPHGAYGTSLPAGRFAEEEKAISGHVVQAAERASRTLGYEGPYPPKGRRQ